VNLIILTKFYEVNLTFGTRFSPNIQLILKRKCIK